jgi:ABC-type sugar transport system permease subunit
MQSKRGVVIFFLAPALIAIGVFFFLPVIAAFILSFTDFDIYSLANLDYARFVGVKNYQRTIEDPLFWKALKNTFYFLLIGGPLSICGVACGGASAELKTHSFQNIFSSRVLRARRHNARCYRRRLAFCVSSALRFAKLRVVVLRRSAN